MAKRATAQVIWIAVAGLTANGCALDGSGAAGTGGATTTASTAATTSATTGTATTTSTSGTGGAKGSTSTGSGGSPATTSTTGTGGTGGSPATTSTTSTGSVTSTTTTTGTGGSPATTSTTGTGGNPATTSTTGAGASTTATSTTATSTTGTGGASSTTTTTGTGGTTSTGGGCVTGADCPGADTACAQRTCTSGTCGFAYAPSGTLAGTQTAGDCQKVVCDGQGGTVAVADDTDVPSDGNPCTNDVCTSGQPSNPPAPAGTSCGASGLCNGAGTCVGCLVDADCGTSTACVTHTCGSGGVCGLSYVPSGQGSPGGQTAGDCQKIVCNGSGGTTSVADDTDVPASTNPCVIPGCSAGQPTQTPAGTGTPCGAGSECNGLGSCVSCFSDADCGAPTACAKPACVGGSCVPGYVPNGQGNPPGQTAGDCLKLVCNGSGGVTAVVDDTNVPANTNPCLTAACSNGVSSITPLAAGTTCGAGFECDGAGSCVGCIMDSECGESTACVTHTCQAGTCFTEYTPAGTGNPGGQTAGDCQVIVCNGGGSTESIPDDGDVPDDGNPCTIDSCSGGVPQHTPVATGTSCGAGQVCNGTACVSACYIGGAIKAPGAAEPGNPCQACEPSVSTTKWSPAADGTTCGDGTKCGAGAHCTSGVCGGATVADGTPCQGTFDQVPYAGSCIEGYCYQGCFINGQAIPTTNSAIWTDPIACANCDPSKSTTSYTSLGCHWGNYPGTCNENDGVCYLAPAGTCSGGPCLACGPVQCGIGLNWVDLCYALPKSDGTSCGAGMTCAGGVCN